jgi:hypothetical protein
MRKMNISSGTLETQATQLFDVLRGQDFDESALVLCARSAKHLVEREQQSG